MSYSSNEQFLGPIGAFKELTYRGTQSKHKLLARCNLTLTDLTVSSSGTIWAIDTFGHLHASKPTLSSENLHDELRLDSQDGDWSSQGITNLRPVCIIGEDDDLWIACHGGVLLHYNGSEFAEYDGFVC